MERQFEKTDQQMDDLLEEYAIPCLRLSLGTIYIWFGGLKLFGVSPIAELVAKVTPILPKNVAVPLVGAVEVAIGVGLLFRIALRRTLFLFILQLISTFLPVLLRPNEVFRKGNPLLLTETGEFIFKNLVLASAGMAVGSTVRDADEEIDSSR
jgi:putative oxidoreductase